MLNYNTEHFQAACKILYLKESYILITKWWKHMECIIFTYPCKFTGSMLLWEMLLSPVYIAPVAITEQHGGSTIKS